MEVLEGQQDVCGVKRCVLELKALAMADVEVQLAADAVVQHEVESVSVLERVLKFDNKGMLCAFKNAPL